MAEIINWLALARSQASRFWAKVDRSGSCWLWTRGKDKDGYGKFAISGPAGLPYQQKHVRAHRLAWEMTNGPAPADAVMMHSCDTPACVNPAHLSPGTQAENRTDCTLKGRNAFGALNGASTCPETRPRGERHGLATIDADVVREVRRLRATGLSYPAIARATRATAAQVYQIIAGKTWRHVA